MMDKENLGIFLGWRDIKESYNFHVGDEIHLQKKIHIFRNMDF